MADHYPIGVDVFDPGDLLIAPPGMIDPRFQKTVLMITHSSNNGTHAICLNKQSRHTVNDLITPIGQALEPDQPLFWGGPMATSTLWMLHDIDWSCDNTTAVNDQWSISSSMKMFQQIDNTAGPYIARFYLGLASWAPGQLELELEGDVPFTKESSWLVAKSTGPEELFSVDPDDLWNWACELSGQQAVSRWLV